jgi:hypothetical protein
VAGHPKWHPYGAGGPLGEACRVIAPKIGAKGNAGRILEMVLPHQVRGVLLEEAILMLLRASGYSTVASSRDDPTLSEGPAGMNVLGRGGNHQIDAIADLRIGQPFSNPQRLLVEAKAYAEHRKVGLPIVRGSVGVLKDVSEYWVKNGPDQPAAVRYHYQFAIFSTSEFTADAQNYAFAHDVYLLPLRDSSFLSPVVRAIEDAAVAIPTDRNGRVDVVLSDVRYALRSQLQPGLGVRPGGDFPWLRGVVDATRQIGRSLIAVLGSTIPVFLTPKPELNLDTLPLTGEIQIHFRALGPGESGAITLNGSAEPIFTFDLPEQLFELYAVNGVLTRRAALDLKEQFFGRFTAIYAPDDEIRVFNFRLDREWVGRLRDDLRGRRRA